MKTKDGHPLSKDLEGNSILNKDNVLILNITKGEARKIGYLDDKSKTLHVKRKRKKHLFRKYNAYGFCYYLISQATRFDKILLQDEEGVYLIPNKVILEEGDFLYFKKIGYEKQIFLRLEEMSKYKQ